MKYNGHKPDIWIFVGILIGLLIGTLDAFNANKKLLRHHELALHSSATADSSIALIANMAKTSTAWRTKVDSFNLTLVKDNEQFKKDIEEIKNELRRR